jgi:hypothetical protein
VKKELFCHKISSVIKLEGKKWRVACGQFSQAQNSSRGSLKKKEQFRRVACEKESFCQKISSVIKLEGKKWRVACGPVSQTQNYSRGSFKKKDRPLEKNEIYQIFEDISHDQYIIFDLFRSFFEFTYQKKDLLLVLSMVNFCRNCFFLLLMTFVCSRVFFKDERLSFYLIFFFEKKKNPIPKKIPQNCFLVKNKGKFLPKQIRTSQKTPKKKKIQKNSFFLSKTTVNPYQKKRDSNRD